MKIKQLKVKNIGCIEDSTIQIDKPLILFYGEIKQGKTTFLNAIRWAFGGSFPNDIIRHGESEALIELSFDNGNISRSFYKNKEGETVSRPQNIVINNQVKKISDLKQFLNPFLLNQNYLADMNKGNDRENYILELFNINTVEIDGQILSKEKEASELRAIIKGYGEITLNVIEQPDIDGLNAKKVEIETRINTEKESVRISNEKLKSDWELERQRAYELVVDFNSEQTKKQTTIDNSRTMLNNIYSQVKGTIFEKCFDIEGAKRILETLPKPEALKTVSINIPEPAYQAVDESELNLINTQIQEAQLQQIKYEQYLKDKQRADAKQKDQALLKEKEADLKDLRLIRLEKLSEIDGKIAGLKANEKGIFYEETAFDMLSTSQIMKLSSELSGMYPEGFGLELIDHGESLGKSIFEFVTKAEKESKTILATIVGEKPAIIPENIGVFVVEKGKLN